jgi:hypothetical protein
MNILARLKRHIEPCLTTGCWLWVGAKNGKGYGRILVGRKNKYAHRVSFELYNGPIPKEKHIDHICRVPACINPAHLRLVTPRENSLENSDGVGAINMRKTHCPQGHEYTPSNTRGLSYNHRMCRECDNARHKARYWKRKKL